MSNEGKEYAVILDAEWVLEEVGEYGEEYHDLTEEEVQAILGLDQRTVVNAVLNHYSDYVYEVLDGLRRDAIRALADEVRASKGRITMSFPPQNEED